MGSQEVFAVTGVSATDGLQTLGSKKQPPATDKDREAVRWWAHILQDPGLRPG